MKHLLINKASIDTLNNSGFSNKAGKGTINDQSRLKKGYSMKTSKEGLQPGFLSCYHASIDTRFVPTRPKFGILRFASNQAQWFVFNMSPWFVSSRTISKSPSPGCVSPRTTGRMHLPHFLKLFFTIFYFLIAGISVQAQLFTTGPMDIEVNNYTGNTMLERTDIKIPGMELNMEILFTYNTFSFNTNRGYGKGWTFLYDIEYEIDLDDNVILHMGDGSVDTFKFIGGGNYETEYGYFDKLNQYQSGKYVWTQENGTRFFFDNDTHKKLTKIITTNENYIDFYYTGSLLNSITNNRNQTISFAYNSDSLLTSVTDAITSPTRTWSYEYDKENHLISVTDPLGHKDQYTYRINGPMQTIKDKNHNVIDLVFYPNHALREVVGCNQRISFVYDKNQKITVVTHHIEGGENQINEFHFKEANNNVLLTSVASNCCGANRSYEYDEVGNIIKETDGNGHTSFFTYDERGNILSETNGAGETTTYTYTQEYSLISSITDPKGNTTTFEYDNKGNPTKVTRSDGTFISGSYDTYGNLITNTNVAGKTKTYAYNSYGLIESITGPGGASISGEVSPRGRVLSLTDALNNTERLEYDVIGRLIKFSDPLNQEVRIQRDPMGNLVLLENYEGESLHFGYDAANKLRKFNYPLDHYLAFSFDGMGNITGLKDGLGRTLQIKYNVKNLISSFIDPAGEETTFIYDKNGNLITKNLPSGRVLTYTYDAANRITQVSDADGIMIQLKYDKNDNISSYTDAYNATYNFTYDQLDRLTNIKNPVGKTSEITYNPTGTVQSFKDENGNITHLEYDDHSKVISLKEPNNATTNITYDANGNISSLTDANGNTTTYTYDPLNRIIRTDFPDGKYEALTYNAASFVTSFKNKDGNTVQYVYDEINQMVSKILPDGNVYNYEYDKTGRVTSATNAAGTIAFTYYDDDRISSETFNGRTVNYAYDTEGRTVRMTYPDETKITKVFDERDQLVAIRKNSEEIASFEYNNAGDLISKTYANGVVTGMQYDFLGRLTGINSGNLQSMQFNYDDYGNIISIIRGDSDKSEFFTYDENNRLLTYKRGKEGGPYNIEDSYTYDAIGNRTAAVINGKNITYTTNNLNQIISVSDGSETINYEYDDNGNLIFDGKYQKTYDAENRLVKDYSAPDQIITYEYDAAGRRITKSVNGIASSYTFSGLEAIEERDESDELRNRAIYMGYMQPVLNEKNDIPYYYHQNHQYSVELLTDDDGALFEQYQYDVFGAQTIYDASGLKIQESAAGNRYGFTGQVFDPETGQNQFFFRNYNPETGLFNQTDLLGYGDGMAMYQYVGNNPANGLDIFGLKDCGTTRKSGLTETVKNVHDLNSKVSDGVSVVETISKCTKNIQRQKQLI